MAHTATLQQAADRAGAGDWAAAKTLYQAAADESGTGQALEGLARACWWLGETRAALEHGQRAFARYQVEGRSAEGAMLGIHLCIWYLTSFDNPTAARGWLSRAQHVAHRSGDPVVMGWTHLVSGYLAADRDSGRRAIELAASAAHTASDADLATMALADLGLWHVGAGNSDRGMAMLDEAMAATLAEPPRMLEVVVWTSCNMLAACSLLDDLARATDWCRAADRFADRYGCPFLQLRCRAHYARVLLATGRWDDAESELHRALAMGAETGRGPRIEALATLAELRLRQGAPEAALLLLEDAEATPWGTITRASCLLAAGRPDDARAVLHGELAVTDTHDPAFPALVASLVEADVSSGQLSEAAALIAPDAPVWQLHALPRMAGMLARAAGLVALHTGDESSARRQLVCALELFARLDLPFEAARTELDLARLLSRSDTDAAVARTTSALRTLHRLGARHEATEAANLLRTMGVTPPPGPRTPGRLSARERDVLLLLPQGLTNPQIAERLYISPRTVGHHVSSILHKLGLTSRAEAAAYATRMVVRDR